MIKLRAVVVLTLVLSFVTGCYPAGISITDEDRAVPECSAVKSVTVESLDDADEAVCDLDGIDVIFPDGFARAAPQLGTSGGSGSSVSDPEVDEVITYSLWNVGLDGVVAARTNFDGSQTEWWGTVQGISRVQQAFGDPAPIYQRRQSRSNQGNGRRSHLNLPFLIEVTPSTVSSSEDSAG